MSRTACSAESGRPENGADRRSSAATSSTARGPSEPMATGCCAGAPGGGARGGAAGEGRGRAQQRGDLLDGGRALRDDGDDLLREDVERVAQVADRLDGAGL